MIHVRHFTGTLAIRDNGDSRTLVGPLLPWGVPARVVDQGRLVTETFRVVADHRVLVRDWCPGWERRPAHPSADLTADHIREVARGGDPYGPLVVRCRSCNAARSARVLNRLLGPDPSPAEVSDTLRTQPPPVVG
jgi:hypothetical protein